MKKILILTIITIVSLNAGYIGKGGLSDWTISYQENGTTLYRIYCNEKNGFLHLPSKPMKNIHGKWYSPIEDDKYMGRSYDNLDVNQFGERMCR